MATPYGDLTSSGFVGSLKRDVLLEASRDVYFVEAVHGEFCEAGDAARLAARDCTTQLIEELTRAGWCSLATWAGGTGDHKLLIVETAADIDAVVGLALASPFIYFLVASPAGTEWVQHYLALVREL